MPDDRRRIDKDKNSGMTPTIEPVIYMLRFHIPGNINYLSQCLQCISRDFLLDVTVKLKPLGLLVDAFTKLIFYAHVGRFHNNLVEGMLLQICVNIEALIYMATE